MPGNIHYTDLSIPEKETKQTNKQSAWSFTEFIVEQLLHSGVGPEGQIDLHVVTGAEDEVEGDVILQGLLHQGQVHLHIHAARDAQAVGGHLAGHVVADG